jgi:hypothetical protein
MMRTTRETTKTTNGLHEEAQTDMLRFMSNNDTVLNEPATELQINELQVGDPSTTRGGNRLGKQSSRGLLSQWNNLREKAALFAILTNLGRLFKRHALSRSRCWPKVLRLSMSHTDTLTTPPDASKVVKHLLVALHVANQARVDRTAKFAHDLGARKNFLPGVEHDSHTIASSSKDASSSRLPCLSLHRRSPKALEPRQTDVPKFNNRERRTSTEAPSINHGSAFETQAPSV